MRQPATTFLLPAAAFLLCTACTKSEQKPTAGPALNTWTMTETTSAYQSVFTASHISRGADGKFRAVGQNGADSIVFSFYQDQLPVTELHFMTSSRADTTHAVVFEA